MITGGMGYIGSVVTQYLQKKGFETDIVDLKCGRDIFDLTEKDFEDIDAVIHLAAIVGDPHCNKYERLALHININGTEYIKNLCTKSHIEKVIFASTCSIYGPPTLYRESKMTGEIIMKQYIIFRFGTVYGWSPNMRYDLVVNKLTQDAITYHKCNIYGGTQWRPFIHVKDIARAMYKALKSDIQQGIYNLTNENIQIINLGVLIQKTIPGTWVNVEMADHDVRNYTATAEHFCKDFNYHPKVSLVDGILEIKNKIRG